MARDQPRIAADIEVIYEKGAALLYHIHGDGYISGAPSDASKRFCQVGVGFGTNQFAVGKTPEVGATGAEKGAGKSAERREELARLTALKSSPGKFVEKLLESLLRLRRVAG